MFGEVKLRAWTEEKFVVDRGFLASWNFVEACLGMGSENVDRFVDSPGSDWLETSEGKFDWQIF